VFLGFSASNNSSWLFGCCERDSKHTVGWRWQECETNDAKILEDAMVTNIDMLKEENMPIARAVEQKSLTVCGPVGNNAVTSGVQPGVQTFGDLRCSEPGLDPAQKISKEEPKEKPQRKRPLEGITLVF
jgi:hypothetical protein